MIFEVSRIQERRQDGSHHSRGQHALLFHSLALAPPGAGNHCIRVYDVVGGRRCKNGRVFAEVTPGVADGLRVDVTGNVWTSSHDSVQVFAPDGARLGKIPVPEIVANVCFGDPDRSTLFIAASTGLYRVRTRTRGASPLDLARAPA